MKKRESANRPLNGHADRWADPMNRDRHFSGIQVKTETEYRILSPAFFRDKDLDNHHIEIYLQGCAIALGFAEFPE